MATSSRDRPPLDSVVKVLTVADPPNYSQPWQTLGPESSSGSGAVIETPRGLRVLTNGHVVQDQVFVEVRRYGESAKYTAELEGVGHECDLALLKVDDPQFFKGARPIRGGPLPQLGEQVTVCGYPIGGDRLSITQGVVSRIEVAEYAQTQRPLLAVQLDAAINSGNSGGPVFKGDKLIGVAFQGLDEGQNISYAIAMPIVEHFLKDVDDGKFNGFPSLGVRWQRLESPSHRRAIQLKRTNGILLTGVDYGGSAWGKLRRGDVLLEVDGVAVASDGTVPLRPGELVDFSYVITRHQTGEKMRVKIWRNKKEMNVSLTLAPPVRLVPEDRYDVMPTYYIFSGFVFTPLTRNFLASFGEDWWHHAPHSLMTLHDQGVRTKKRHEVVIMTKVLADRVNQGYHDMLNLEIVHVDGKPVSSLKELVGIVERNRTAFVTFDAADGQRICCDKKLAQARHNAILRRYSVPKDRSDDLVGRRPSPRTTWRKRKSRKVRP